MQARFHDGLTSAAHEVEVRVEPESLYFTGAGVDHIWPRAQVESEALGQTVRLGRPGDPARLVVRRTDWAALTGQNRFEAARRNRGYILVAALTLGGAAAALAVFVGVPMASGPLARITPPEYEAGMGRSYEAQLGLALKACKGAAGQAALGRLGDRLGKASASPFPIRVSAVEAPMANAFALPGGAVWLTDDLIEMAETPDELAAVVAHETAHVEKRHVMQAVWRALGFGLILDVVVGGGTGAGQQAVLLAGSIADLRHSRAAEREADARGQDLLTALGLSSKGMAAFFARLADSERDGREPPPALAELVSTHPDALDRAAIARARERPGAPALTPAEWQAVKSACSKPSLPAKREGGTARRGSR